MASPKAAGCVSFRAAAVNTVTAVAEVSPQVTVAALWKFAQTTSTKVLPAGDLLAGEMAFSTGAGSWWVRTAAKVTL